MMVVACIGYLRLYGWISLPQLLILPLSELPEIPAGLHMFRRQDLDSLRSDSGELHLIDRMAIPLINDREALMKDGLAFLKSLRGVPLVGNQGKSEVFGESSGEVVLDDVVAVEVDAGKMRLSVLKTSNNEVVVVGVLIVALLIAHPCQVIGVIRNRVADVIIKEETFMGELPQSSRRLLEVRILTGGRDQNILRDLLVSIDIVQDTQQATIGEQRVCCNHDSLVVLEGDDCAAGDDGTGDVADGAIFRLHLRDHFQIFFKQPQRNNFIPHLWINIFIMDSRTKRGHSSHQGNINKSFKIGGSLAEENYVRSFNKQRNNRSMAPSQPHRIQLPLFFNTPTRIAEDTSMLNKTAMEDAQKLEEKVDNATYITVMRRLKDYEMLAFGCRRAGKVRDEGRAYYSIGVLYDNIKKYKKAVEYYLKFLQVCKSINDSHGEALAYNCIGVDYQLLGEADPEYTRKAIEYHTLHEALADVNGKFLASINLGLCHDRLGDQKNSIYFFQNALKHSIQMSNLSGQSVAMGNIGKIGTKDLSDNKDKMKLFVEKYLKLSSEMKDSRGEMQGCLKLGMISSTKKNFQQGKENFKRALQLAEQSGNTQVYNQAKFGFAVVAAQKGMNNFLGYYSSKLNRRSDN